MGVQGPGADQFGYVDRTSGALVLIICNSKRFIFIHIPKCGGTTVSHILEERLLPQDVSLARSPHTGWERYLEAVRKRYKLSKHSTAKELAQAMGADYFKDYFAFTFVRNPFSRAYSAFSFTKSADAKHRPDSERYQEIKDLDFEQFLESKYMQQKLMIQSRDQSIWIVGAPSAVKLFRLEDLSKDLNVVLKKFYDVELPDDAFFARNNSAPRDAWRNMSTRARDMIVKLYADDFEALGYPRTISA